MTESDSFAIQLQVDNEIDYILINRDKIKGVTPGNHKYTVALKPGMNEIKIGALKNLKQQSDTFFVFSNHNSAFLFEVQEKMDHYALFIALDQFRDLVFSPLANPVFDARTIAGELNENYGFQIDSLINPTKTEILLKLRELALMQNKSAQQERNDHFLIFISGHGVYDEIGYNQGFLVTHDSKNPGEDPIYESYLSYADLQDKIDKLGFKHILVVLEAISSSFGVRGDPDFIGWVSRSIKALVYLRL